MVVLLPSAQYTTAILKTLAVNFKEKGIRPITEEPDECYDDANAGDKMSYPAHCMYDIAFVSSIL